MHAVVDIALVALFLGAVTLAGFGALVGWRTVRRVRRWRRRLQLLIPSSLRAPDVEAVAAAWDGAHRSLLAAGSMVTTGSLRRSLSQRHQLRSHMDAAGSAARQARLVGAPVGDLPFLLTQLADQARRHDRVLQLSGSRASVVDRRAAEAETRRLTDQADRVTAAVVEMLRSDAAFGEDQLAVALDNETRAVTGAAAHLRSLSR